MKVLRALKQIPLLGMSSTLRYKGSMSKSFEVTNRNLAILYIVANDHAPAKDEPQSRNIVRTISYSLH